jgi:hypothetical protein
VHEVAAAVRAPGDRRVDIHGPLSRRPAFSGVWKLVDAADPQFVIIDQRESELRFAFFVGDRLGTVKGPIDGRSHPQSVNGVPAEFLARWQAASLFFETTSRCRTRKRPRPLEASSA